MDGISKNRFSVKKNNAGLHFITRIDHWSTHGYCVRFSVHGSVVMNKLFSDGVHGGKRRALNTAKALRDMCLDAVEKHKKVRCHSVLSPRSKTGIIGVTKYTRVFVPGKKRYYYSASYYPERYKKATKTFSVMKYGPEKALELACQFRINGIGNTAKVRQKIIREIRKG